MESRGIILVLAEVSITCSRYGDGCFESVYRGFESLLPSLNGKAGVLRAALVGSHQTGPASHIGPHHQGGVPASASPEKTEARSWESHSR